MRGKLRIAVPLLAAAAFIAVAVVLGRFEMAIVIAEAVAAMCFASVLMGFVLRRRWRMTLWCMWLVAVQGWVLGMVWEIGAPGTLVRSQLQCCDLMTLCILTMLAASLVLVRPCHEFGAGLRKLAAVHQHAADTAVGQLT